MGSYSVRADETELALLVSRAEAGEEIVLSREGVAVAKIIPFPVTATVAVAEERRAVPRPYGQNFSGLVGFLTASTILCRMSTSELLG